MATEYNPKVLQDFADEMYSEALSTTVWHAAGWGIACGALALVVGELFHSEPLLWVFCGGLAGAGLGYIAGKSKASLLKLQAQQALCQMKIEENTRAVSARTSPTQQ